MDYEAAAERVRARGVTPTRQRVLIAQILLSRPQHLSADQVLALVNRTDVRVSKATVYNTLGLFARRGLVRVVIVDPSKVFYDPTTGPHHHFYNIDDGTLTDVMTDAVTVVDVPLPPPGTELAGVEVIIRVRRASLSTPLPTDN